MSTLMKEHHLIREIMNKLTHDISMEVDFDYLKPHLVRIFTRSDLQRAEGRNKASVDIMIKVCEIAGSLSMSDFLQFAAAIRVDYKHIFNQINNEYRCRTQKDLPLVQESGDDRMTSLLAEHSSNASSHQTNAPSPVNVSQSGGESLSHTAGSRNLASTETSEPNSVQSEIIFVSHGPAVLCPSDQTSLDPADICSSTQLPSDTSGSAQTNSVNCTLESQTSNQNQPILGANQDQDTQSSMTKYEKMIRKDHENVYSMDYLPRGRCIIINNEEFDCFTPRKGSQKDIGKLIMMFEFLDFDVFSHKNITTKKIKSLLSEFATSSALEKMSALAVVILSHGGDKDCIFGSDGAIRDNIPVADTFITKFDLQQMFTIRNCPLMKGKPKLFIIQACRGDNEDKEENSDDVNLSADNSKMNSEADSYVCDGNFTSGGSTQGNSARADTADMLFIHSSSSGYKAYRHPYDGSPFVAIFTEAIMKSASNKNLLSIIMDVQRDFSTKQIGTNKMTMPEYSSSLTKNWYLNPQKRLSSSLSSCTLQL